MSRSRIHLDFVYRFARLPRVPGIPLPDLDQAEERLGVVMPQAYRDFLSVHGALTTPGLLSHIANADADLWEIGAFLSPTACVETTETYRAAGMPERLVAFANDSSGNVFCFEEGDLLDARPEDAPVWFFDLEFSDGRTLAPSFDAWLGTYVALP